MLVTERDLRLDHIDPYGRDREKDMPEQKKPKDESLKKDAGWTAGGIALGGAVGAYAGSGIGIAALGTAVAGTLPGLAAGAVVGGLVIYAWRASRRARKH